MKFANITENKDYLTQTKKCVPKKKQWNEIVHISSNVTMSSLILEINRC
jgi:hypothetical protein